MPKKTKKKAVADSGQSASQPLAGASPAELQLLASLLRLLRSGSPLVQSLVSAGQGPQGQHTAALTDGAAVETLQGAPWASSSQVATKSKLQASPPTVEPGWEVPKPNKKKEQKPKQQEQEVAEVLSLSNAKVVASTGKLTRDNPCVCLATQAEAAKAVAEMSSSLPMAILAPTKVGDRGVEVQVLMKKGTQTANWTRFVIQLGKEDVVFDHSQVAVGGQSGGGEREGLCLRPREQSSKRCCKHFKRRPRLLSTRG